MSALRRFLHTSRPLANPSSVSDIFAQHLRSSSPSGSSSASSSIAEKGRAMIGSSTSRASQEDIGRSTFYPNQVDDLPAPTLPSVPLPHLPPSSPPTTPRPPKRIAKKIDPFHASATDPLDFTLNPNFPSQPEEDWQDGEEGERDGVDFEVGECALQRGFGRESR
ncbi:hypothetical protein EHS25_002659 [Saitozyma podzolica]|uniref:Uncharacterized protein n=1 Tax=Saitozyma podzolica TaxID=1890683 RepID=A0A427YDF7_9TREE|nr:hypothetical protein EHS25_002659 [Saitozyma podzolica]